MKKHFRFKSFHRLVTLHLNISLSIIYIKLQRLSMQQSVVFGPSSPALTKLYSRVEGLFSMIHILRVYEKYAILMTSAFIIFRF